MRKVGIAGFAVAALAIAAGAVVASCGQTPTNVPIRTFEGAQKMAVVCLHVNDDSGKPLPGVTPVAQSHCAPVAPDVNGAVLPYHLYAAVTQTTRGELAIVDLTAQNVVDEDRSTPGVNFIPVGTNPTDVAESPDQSSSPPYTFVSSASPTKPAIYAIDNTRILGDATGTASAPLLLTDLRACSLSQPPLALAVSSVPVAGAALDFRIIALLGAGPGRPATVATIDPSFARTSAPGALPPCTILGETILGESTLSSAVPPTWTPGPAWPDGVPYVDGGITGLSAVEPSLGPAALCAQTTSGGGTLTTALPDAGALDAATDAGSATPLDAGAEVESDAATGDASPTDGGGDLPDGELPLVLGPLSASNPVSMVLRDDASILYVADSTLPLIHVFDVSKSPPLPLAPLLATSLQQTTRQVQVGALALSPTTRDYKRFLYAVDEPSGSLMVFDVTDPVASPHVPLLRPHPELNPLVPLDRLTFSAPIATVAFAQHDWPLQLQNDTVNAYQGLLCNPGPNAFVAPSMTYNDLGAHYRGDQASSIQPQGVVQSLPTRLRGIFGFVTLTDGTLVTIDVDDWDAPCRRWDPMDGDSGTGELAVPEPLAPTGDLDPYHVPQSYASNTTGVTLEPFFPVSAPHRMRSQFLLRNDPSAGVHIPQVSSSVTLVDDTGMQLSTALNAGKGRPILMPTTLGVGMIDPTLYQQNPTEPDPLHRVAAPAPPTFPGVSTADGGTDAVGLPAGVRISFDDPTAQQNQDWSVTYEGVIPGSQNIQTDISPHAGAGGQKLDLQISGGNLCALGIEDADLGAKRAAAALAEMGRDGLVPSYALPGAKPGDPEVANPESGLASWTGDYVEFTDDLLTADDPYWQQNSCWGDTGAIPTTTASERYATCSALFGTLGSNADGVPARDAPILEAYKDHLVTGAFEVVPGNKRLTPMSTTNRRIAQSGSYLPRLQQCCFRSQATVRVRAGGEWLATGNTLGLLHHIKTDPDNLNRCVLSCDPSQVLLNGRSFDVPWAAPNTCTPLADPRLGRNDALAMRNPMFSYVMWAGCGPLPAGDRSLTPRDLSWRFSITGGFTPLTVALSGTSASGVSPQSMLFINSLGQLAVVDGAQQGLILVDLNSVTFARNYF